PEKEIVVMGRSLGGAVASNLAKNNNPSLLILESAFTSTADMAASAYPIFPVRLLCRFGYRNIENVKSIKCPLLVIHSPNDEIVPYSHGRKIFDAAKEPKEFLRISGSHNEGFDESKEAYVEGLKIFLGKY
ncbi:MAG: alpha/beta hydrolase, partial [Victivallales bacterium]